VYSNANQTALHVLCNNIANIGKIALITGDFNIRDSDWDPNYHHHSTHMKDLTAIADSLSLKLFPPIKPRPYDSNSVLDLVFLAPNNPGFGKHSLLPGNWRFSDYVFLLITVRINDKNINTVIQSIKKDSNEEKDFVNDIINSIKGLNTTIIMNKDLLLNITSHLSQAYENAWSRYSKPRRITKHSKKWWNQQCSDRLSTYHQSRNLEDWKFFKSSIKEAKWKFFDKKIHKIATSNKRLWDLMNWIKKKTLPSIKTISYERQPCNTLLSLWNALHHSYNSAENQPINTNNLNDITQSNAIIWLLFSKQEFRDAIAKCFTSSISGPDHIL